MRLYNPFRRRVTTKEHRLTFELEGAENMPVNMNMSQHDERNLPEGTIDEQGNGMAERVKAKYGSAEANTQPTTLADIVDMIDMGIKNTVGDLEADFTVDYNQVLDEVGRHIMKMPDMQRGVIRMTDVMQRGWNYFWDLVQMNKALPMTHPVITSRRWKNGMRLPGIYYKGKLAKISSRMLGPYQQRQLSGEYKRFGKVKKLDEAFDQQVDWKIRDKVKVATIDALSLPTEKDLDGSSAFDTLQWKELTRGNAATGQPHILRMHKPAGKMDDAFTYEPGEEPFNGLVFAYEDAEDPMNSEVLYVDFKKTNEFLWMAKHESPIMKALLTKPGYFSAGQTELYRNLFDDFPNTKDGLDDIGIDFYLAHPEIGRLFKEEENLMYIYDSIRNTGVTEADLSWLPGLDPDIMNNAEAEKLYNLQQAVQAGVDDGQQGVWKRALRSLMPVYTEQVGEDWFSVFLNAVIKEPEEPSQI